MSAALFNNAPLLHVDRACIEDLKQRAQRSPSRRFRLCLHRTPESAVQEMVVVHCRDNYSRPHGHDRPVTLMVIEGELRILVFDDEGRVTRTLELGSLAAGKSVAVHLQPDTWYMPVCLTPQVVFFEVKAGPFERESSNRWAPWSPAEDDADAIAGFRRALNLPDD